MELPDFLKRTPEEVAEDSERQDKARAMHRRSTPAEARVQRAILTESAIKANLAQLKKNTPVYIQTVAMLAENLAEQGRYTEAAKLAVGDAKKEYKDIAKAIDRDDADTCKCAPEVFKGDNGRRELLSQNFVTSEVYSEKHGRIVSVTTCAKCGITNAK